MILEAFKPVRKAALRGFARVRLDSGLVMDDIAIHIGGDDGSAWASHPARPMLDANGLAMRDATTGKVRYQGLIAFTSANVRRKWSDQIIRLVRERHSEVFAGVGGER